MTMPDGWSLARASDPTSMLVAAPTVKGRERSAVRLERSLWAQTEPADTLLMRGYSTCGEAWNDAAAWAGAHGYRYLVLTADDLEAAQGALAAARAALDAGWSPSALIARACPTADCEDTIESHGDWGRAYHGEGDVAVSMTRIPAVRVEWWRPIPPIHYYSDNAVTAVLRMLDVPILASRAFAWRHHWEQPGRISGVGEQATREQAAYAAFEARLVAGGAS
jgi:hypothetical protein